MFGFALYEGCWLCFETIEFPILPIKSNLLHDVFQEDESADIELKDLGAGVAMLHHEDEGHFEDMKLGSSSSASRSPSYQSANTSINSRDIEIPRSKLSISSPPRIFKFYFGFQMDGRNTAKPIFIRRVGSESLQMRL